MTDILKYSATRKEMYFSENFSDIEKELKLRAKNTDLDEKLNAYWNSHKIPGMDFLTDGPYVILSRTLASPNLEQKYFLALAQKYNLTPVILEYDGKFVTRNAEKFSLCRMYFFNGKNKQKYKSPRRIDIVDINSYQGKKMSEISTYHKKSLSDFHHELFASYPKSKNCKLYNFTEWFNKARIIGPDYYFFFLLIFMKNAVLFDNYILSDRSEADFIKSKILPSMEKIKKEIGVKPLIFPLAPFKTEADMRWLAYDYETEQKVKNTFNHR